MQKLRIIQTTQTVHEVEIPDVPGFRIQVDHNALAAQLSEQAQDALYDTYRQPGHELSSAVVTTLVLPA